MKFTRVKFPRGGKKTLPASAKLYVSDVLPDGSFFEILYRPSRWGVALPRHEWYLVIQHYTLATTEGPLARERIVSRHKSYSAAQRSCRMNAPKQASGHRRQASGK